MSTSPPVVADFLTAHASILVFLAAVVGLLLGALILWRVLRPARFSEEKLTTYECGEEPVGNAWIQFNIRFYVFALIFVVFDVEAVFLLPWATVFRELGWIAYLKGSSSSRSSEEKHTTYECGEEPVGNAWIQFNIRFYVFALIFIVFDVEAVFLLPWATVFRELGALAYVEGLVFIAILVVALAYVWRKGDLAWVRPEDRA